MTLTCVLTASEPVNQQIYRFLRQNIVTGTIVPGTLLSEKEVSASLNISRQPVREALIKLSESGLVQILPQRGSFVRKISQQRVIDGRFIRQAVEVAVVRRAAQECSTQDIMQLEYLIAQQKLAALNSDSEVFLRLDDEFHRVIAKSINCELAWETVENINATMDRVRFLTLSEESPPMQMVEQHEMILQAIKAADPLAAETAIQHHLEEMVFSLPQVVARHPDWFDL
jgi:DNA-binding GntR family transcriptional regulator